MNVQWAGIVRISHMGERKAGANNVHADRDQVDAMKRHAAIHGAELHLLPAELDVSGGLPLERRPSLMAAIEGVEAGRYDAIIVAYLSRLGRNVREQLRAWDRVEAAGGKIIVVQEGIDTSTPTGRLQRTIMLGIAEHEREQHAERFENLRIWATQAGVWQRRQTPLGYIRDPDSRKLIPSADADRVRRAFDARAHGKPLSAIARDLGMTPSGARGLLRNRVYLGELTVGQHTNPAAHPAIVQDAAWHEAQTARITRPARHGNHPAVLAGLIRCAGCSHAMGQGRSSVKVYGCTANHSDGRCPAPAAITAALIEDHVQRIALAHLARLRARPVRDDSELRDARAAITIAEAELTAFLAGVQAAGLAPGEFADGARQRRDMLTAARTHLATLVAQNPNDVTIDGDPVALWHTLNDSERNHLLGRLIEVVLVGRAGGRGHIVPIETRVRVIRAGAGLVDTKRYRGTARASVTVALPEHDDEQVLATQPA
jgi:DNA invertase Pin-like site-specific DNA recombinase